MHTGLYWGNLREGGRLEDSGVDGRIILKCVFKKRDGGMDWIELAVDMNVWRARVNAKINFRGFIKFA